MLGRCVANSCSEAGFPDSDSWLVEKILTNFGEGLMQTAWLCINGENDRLSLVAGLLPNVHPILHEHEFGPQSLRRGDLDFQQSMVIEALFGLHQ